VAFSALSGVRTVHLEHDAVRLAPDPEHLIRVQLW
jgi:hypothetical protein